MLTSISSAPSRISRSAPPLAASSRAVLPLGFGVKPMSSPPTRLAAVCSTFQVIPNACATPAAAANTAAPSARASAPAPTMIAGDLAAFSAATNAGFDLASPASANAPVPRCS